MNQAHSNGFTSNTYEMNYMNPPASNPSAGIPIHNPHQSYGFQYTYTPPDGNPPKYEDVINGNYGQQNAYSPTAPLPFNQNEDYNYFPSSPNPVLHTSSIRNEPESRFQTPPQVQQQSQLQDNTQGTEKTKPKTNWCWYFLLRIIIALIIGGIIRGIVYAAYK